MKRFKFRLQQVLDYRAKVRKDQERELAFRNLELYSAEEDLSEILQAQDSCVPPTAVQSMAELKLTGDFQLRLRADLEQQRVLVKEAMHAVDAARDAYIEKAVEAKILETLKEKRRALYKEERHKAERKELDEMVIQRHKLKKHSNE